ncbi:MAG TPA: ribbon-helix-helix protein, CopG family [Desulfotomaculum sp.]|nr:ribbon-helix-helix protein, CopG family [Desulfotomaculum sp.]
MEQVRTTIRMPASLLKAVEEVRESEEFPTLSDFIRRAVERYVKDIKRTKLAEECRRLAGEEDLSALTEADFAEHAERMAQAERTEL